LIFMDIIWTDYLRYRGRLRNFELEKIEDIVRHSAERYYDMATHRIVAVGRHYDKLVLIPYERQGDIVTPVTIHVTTRQQINFRLRTGRYRNE
jgi:hypothetical protein